MGNNGKQWSGRSRGGGFGYNFFILLMKVAGIRSAYAFLSLVVVYFIPFAPRATRAVWFYNRRILGYGRLHSAVKLYAHYYALGQTIIDRVAIGSGMERKYKFEFENYDAFLRVLDGGRGAVIIGAHVGCWGTGAGFFGDYARKMHLVMYDAEYRQIKSVMEKHCGQEGYKVIAVNEGGIESILRIKEVLDRKEYVCFQGDRFVEGSPTVTLPFMRHEAPFPAGPFAVAGKFRAPGGLLLCHARTRQALPLHLRHPGRGRVRHEGGHTGQLRTLARGRGETLPAAVVQLLSVLVVSACSILLVSANRHTSPYPVYPLGLSYLKTYLERTINGIRVDIADCNLLSDAQLAERIRTLAPRYIGLSLRNVDGANSLDRRGFLPQYRALADVIRAASDAPLIIGGAGFSIYPEAFMRELGADYGIHGEGEEPLAELIGALERGRTEIDIPSVYTRDGRRGSGRRSYLPSIEVQFEPELTGYYWKRSGMLNIQTKRGCPYDCIYCSYPSIDGRCVRTMDPEAIAENILRAKRDYGISYLFFTDSVFNIGPEYNVRLAETLIRRRTDIRWGAYFSPRGIDAEQMRLFRASGLTHIEFGTESFCDRTLEAYGKRFTFGDVERASRLALDEGVYYAHFLILGGYGDTRENVRETIENSRRMEYTVMFPYAGMRIYPHTRLAELAAKEGAIGRDDDLMAPSYYISRDFDLEEVRRAALATGKAWVFPDDPQSALADTLRLKRNKKGPLWEYLRKP